VGHGLTHGIGFAGLKFRRQNQSNPHPFNSAILELWYNGRAAIWHGAHDLGLNAGDRVLVPAYSCGAELDALVKADFH
jgi:hypothetical protein